ncbi:hypothetical protein ACR9LT_07640 [Helicobacter pylori]
MWNEKILKIIPGLLFLFCILSVIELLLIIEDMNKTEKLEVEVKKNLAVIETITEFLNDHLEGMQQQQEPKIKLFKNR